MRNRNNLTFTLVALLVVVVGLSVAYAALSTTLNVTVNKVTENALTWNIAWGSTCTLSESSTSSTGKSCGTATGSGANLTISATTLSKPGDYCHYTCTIQNSGSIAAKFTSITPTAPTVSSGGGSCTTSGSTITCKNSGNTTVLTYKIGKNATCTTALSTSDTIAAKSGSTNGSLTVYVCVDYADAGLQTTTNEFTNAKFAIVFGQN